MPALQDGSGDTRVKIADTPKARLEQRDALNREKRELEERLYAINTTLRQLKALCTHDLLKPMEGL
jgi:hypothetical protein